MGQESKIKSREELIKTIEDFKKQGKKIVHCHGCFDLLHPGHIRHLRFAKEQGDVLLVSITGDNFVGKSYMNPFATQNLRAQSLASLQDVDLVYINESPIGTDLVKEIKPDIYIKGQEYARDKKVHPGFVEEKALVESLGGKIVYSPGDLIFSSSQIIKDLLERDDAKKERIYNFLVRHSIKRDNLIGVVKDYGLKKILVIGDLFLEDYVFCVKPKMSSNASVLNFELLNKKRFLGGTGLFAQNIVEMGANPIVLGIGNNKVLEIVNEITPKLKDKMEFIYKDDFSLPTRTTFISDEQKIVELTDKKGLKIDEKSEIDFVNRAIRLLNEVDAVIFCDYGNGFLNKGIVNPIIEEARNKGILCTALIDNESFGKVMDYSFLDFVVCSEKEARQAVNNFVDGIDFLSRDFLSKTKYKNLIINLGREGLISYNPIIDPQQISSTYASYLPFLSNQITDISGMKEALISAITLSLASKSGIQHALYLGGAASSIASSKMGNEPVSNEEIVSFIEKQYN